MKHSVFVAFLTLWIVTGCGKVGDPRPPYIRIPAKIGDLNAVQNQHQVVLSWTNPSKYVDGSNASDLTQIRILLNDKPVTTVEIVGAGKTQSTAIDASGAIGTTQIYALAVETRRGKSSGVSNSVRVPIVEVPGPVAGLRGVMDQHRIRLDWQPPAGAPSYADAYIVRREDGAVPEQVVTETHFEDLGIQDDPKKTYSYIVTAARKTTVVVPGQASSPISVSALDKTAPVIPKGLQLQLVTDDKSAILVWDENVEVDLAGYRVYRSDNPNSGFVRLNPELQTLHSTRDAAYRPGVYYSITAEDTNGNESLPSMPLRVP